MINSHPRVIVVGAGHNGMVAASYLARAGLGVTVVERREKVGGLTSTDEIAPGFFGNTGTNNSHSFDHQIASDMRLTDYGLEFQGCSPSSIMLFPEGRVYISRPDAPGRQAELSKFAAASDIKAYRDLMSSFTGLAERLNASVFEPPPPVEDLRVRGNEPRHVAFLHEVLHGNIADLVQSRLKSPELRVMLALLGVTSNFAGPRSQGTAFGLLARPLYNASGRHLRGSLDRSLFVEQGQMPLGGMGAITQAMSRSIEADGVALRLGDGVSEICCNTNGVSGVVLDSGEELPADIVISNANPRMTLTTLVAPTNLSADFLQAVRALDMRGCAFKIALALDGTPRFAAARSSSENDAFLRCGFRIAPSIE